ncbi:hypothetical protein ES703_113212 [subsurface metagenome]
MRTTQPKNRSILGFLSREYGNLTDEQRVLWETYALNHPHPDGFGGTFIMSGQNAYIMLNHTAVRMWLIGALMTDPPTDPPPASIYVVNVVTGAVDPGDIDLTWAHAGSPVAADKNEIRIAGPFQSQARQEVHSRFRTISSTTGETTMLTLSGLVEDTWYWINMRYVDHYGQVTAWNTGQATPKLTV